MVGAPKFGIGWPRFSERMAPTGEVDRYLAELKVISAGPTRYPRGLASSRDKAVNRRARALPAEYRHKLSVIDSTYNGTGQGEVGPCVARLETLGGLLELVVGAFGEASADLGRTIKALAESRVLYLSRETGKPVTEGWSSVVLSQYRRYFSVLFVRVQAACLTASLPGWATWALERERQLAEGGIWCSRSRGEGRKLRPTTQPM